MGKRKDRSPQGPEAGFKNIPDGATQEEFDEEIHEILMDDYADLIDEKK